MARADGAVGIGEHRAAWEEWQEEWQEERCERECRECCRRLVHASSTRRLRPVEAFSLAQENVVFRECEPECVGLEEAVIHQLQTADELRRIYPRAWISLLASVSL